MRAEDKQSIVGCASLEMARARPEARASGTSHLEFLDDERREFVVEMRWDAGFDAGGLAIVTALDDLSDLMQAGHDLGPVLRNGELEEFAQWPQLAAKL